MYFMQNRYKMKEKITFFTKIFCYSKKKHYLCSSFQVNEVQRTT